MASTQNGNIPRHVAIIMDGNGRWARRQSMPRIFGHKSGADRVRDVVEAAGEMGIGALTLYAFSEENWGRPREEVIGLFGLLNTYLKKEVARLHEKNVKLRTIGDFGRLPVISQRLLDDAMTLTSGNTGLQLTLALSYGGRSEIVEACRNIARLARDGKIDLDDIDQSLVHGQMATSDLPDPDLLIRTSGEQRISNFLLWQMAYTEFYFSPVNWPDFTRAHFEQAVQAYQGRQRRFGRVVPEDELATAPAARRSSDQVGEFSC